MTSNAAITTEKATGSHFTPPDLARFVASRVWEALGPDQARELRVLDPACGDGELLVAMAETAPLGLAEHLTLIGVDTNQSAIGTARERLRGLGVREVVLRPVDFLEMCRSRVTAQPSLFEADEAVAIGTGVDAIIANPPYVRTQVLGAHRARQLAEGFGLQGRVDIYQAFLVGMTRCLSPGGVLGVITSNRFLTTNAGECTRQLLAREYGRLDVIDLGDTKLFGAAVLPAVCIGQRPTTADTGRPRPAPTGRFGRIYEVEPNDPVLSAGASHAASVLAVLEGEQDGVFRVEDRTFRAAFGAFDVEQPHSQPWRLVTPTEKRWLATIRANSECVFGDVGTVSVGIKTTADSVFVRRKWADVPEGIRPEDRLLRPMLSHDDAAKWRCCTPPGDLRRVLYTHEMREGRRAPIELGMFPRAAAYLEQHRTRLEKREYVTRSGREWYEIWVPQDPGGWAQPKLVFPDISTRPMFFLDRDGCIVGGNCYWISIPPDEDAGLLYLMLGVGNSSLIAQYHDLCFANRLYAGRRRYLTQYVQRYPLPRKTSPEACDITAIARDLALCRAGTPDAARMERQLDAAVCAAFGVDPLGTR